MGNCQESPSTTDQNYLLILSYQKSKILLLKNSNNDQEKLFSEDMGDPSPLASKLYNFSNPYNLSKLRQSNKNNMQRINLQVPDEISNDSKTYNLLRSSQEVDYIKNENDSLKMVIEEMKSEMEKTSLEVKTMVQEIYNHKNDKLYIKNENNDLRKDI